MANGAKLIQLRAKNISEYDYIILARRVINISKKYDCRLILNTKLEIANKLGADGIHLTSERLFAFKKRPLGASKLVSASCHNETQLIKAKSISVDFVTLSPVLHTTSHIDVKPLGWEKFSQLCQKIDIPIFALGGMNSNHMVKIRSCGGHGIAAIKSLWNRRY